MPVFTADGGFVRGRDVGIGGVLPSVGEDAPVRAPEEEVEEQLLGSELLLYQGDGIHAGHRCASSPLV